MFNTIRLLKGTLVTESKYYKGFEKGDTIFGLDADPEEIRKFTLDQKEEAVRELKKYKCEYNKHPHLYDITEYALEYCNYDENGEFVEGSDYSLAEVAE